MKPKSKLTVSEALAIVAEARATFGLHTARGLWKELGLPVVTALAIDVTKVGPGADVDRFCNEALEYDPTAVVPAKAVHKAYVEWCAERSIAPLNAIAFGKRMAKRRVAALKSNTVQYCGFRLRSPPLPHAKR